jgi:hypothetical protein
MRDVAQMAAVIDHIEPFGSTKGAGLQSAPVEPRLVEV